MKKIATLLFSACVAMSTTAQSEARTANYFPQGNAFVCVNGNNHYSRALYGSNRSEWRLETSDVPIFATYKKDVCRNIRFQVLASDGIFALDSASYCMAGYVGGRRDYTIRDPRLGNGTLRMAVVAFPDREGAIWRLVGDSLDGIHVGCLVGNVTGKKFHRCGDLGTIDQPETSFAQRQGEKPLATTSGLLPTEGRELYFVFESDTLFCGTGNELAALFASSDSYREHLAGSIVFTTPDPYINPIGSALTIAADGAWDGKVWLHGAVGWRMPLPGWRAAYMGDFLGMPQRQRTHFDAYAKSQVTGVPVTLPHLMDSANNLARGTYRWGTPMYSNGYICRSPENNRQFHHYDMNLNYIDELLWHFQFDADTAYMRQMWPVIRRHLAWEKNTWDPDNDALYDAYCCIWASDALQYNSGAVTHASAYNYRGNLLAARIAEIIGEDPQPYSVEASRILNAINARLWLSDEGHWAEFQDFMGLKRIHNDAALWSIYTPIDCGACSPEQAYEATKYVDTRIPHIRFSLGNEQFSTISTSDWAPYEWSINNVAMAEVSHMALAYFHAGRPDAGFKLLKSNLIDFMYMGTSPANFGQISKYDANLGEAYRDFSDVTGITSRALIEGLFGITPQALDGRCIIRPGFPTDWDSASVKTPYIEYSFRRSGSKEYYKVIQNFTRPLQIVIRQNIGNGHYKDTAFSSDSVQTIVLDTVGFHEEPSHEYIMTEKAEGTALAEVITECCNPVNISKFFNSEVTDIFKNKYLSPRSPYTTLALPTQGIGDWCSTKKTADINDCALRAIAAGGTVTIAGVPFSTPSKGKNIVYTSIWDNYPDSIEIPLCGRASHVYLLMAGSTNPMQSHFENGVVRITYSDGNSETLSLRNPSNWCPIEQDYDDGSPAFTLPKPRPWRIGLKTGKVSRTLSESLAVRRARNISDSPTSKVPPLTIDGGAAEVLEVRLNPRKKLRKLVLRTTANDVVIGLMAITVQTPQ